MFYSLIGDSDNPLADISLGMGEQVKIERGAMVYMQDVELQGTTNSNSKGVGGFFKAAARSIASGESLFITLAKGTGPNARLGIAPGVPGFIEKLEVGAKQYRLNTSAFLACDDSVSYNVVAQKNIGKALFGGTGGFFIMETTGSGDLLVNAFGALVTLDVTPDRPLTIDNEHVVAWDSTLDYQIRVASGVIGFTSGEGLVNEFHGSGKVLVQTRNIHNMASALAPFLPNKN